MLLSICIPTYSRLPYLQECVASVYKQKSHSYEICISIDPKSDGPDKAIVAWCSEEAKLNSKFRFQVNSSNRGLAGNWNELVNMAIGEYLIVLGDDDRLLPNYVSTFVAALSQTDADVGFCDQLFIDSDGKIDKELTEQNSENYHRATLPKGLIAEPIKVVLQNSVPMSSALIRRSWLLRFPFDKQLNTPELEVFLKIAVANGTFYYEPQRLAEYRVHSTSATSSGLTVHRFVSNLIEIAVPAVYEPYKRQLIAGQIRVAVNRYLKKGDKKNADLLLNSHYYPSGHLLYKTLQKVLLYSPQPIINLLGK